MTKEQLKRDEAFAFVKEIKKKLEITHLETITAVKHESSMKLALLNAIISLEQAEKELAEHTMMTLSQKLEQVAIAAKEKLNQAAAELSVKKGDTVHETQEVTRYTVLTMLEEAEKLAQDMIESARTTAEGVIENTRATSLKRIEREEIITSIKSHAPKVIMTPY